MAEPRIESRDPQPYVAIAAHVESEADFRRAADRGFPALFGWLAEHGLTPDGPPFIRSLALGGDGEPRDIELGAPVPARAETDGEVVAGTLPPGRYVVLLHAGPYTHATETDLRGAHTALRAWADRHDVALDQRRADGGTALGCCVERYLIGPADEGEYARWRTELLYLVAS